MVHLLLRCVLALFVLAPSVAVGDGLWRESSGDVVLQSGPTALRFSAQFGGAPNEWWRQYYPLLTNSFAGAGAQPAVRTNGNDPTVSSSNGIMPNPIARIGAPATWMNAYFARETIFDPVAMVYEVVTFGPDFWASIDKEDDAIAANADGSDSGWRTPYAPGGFAALLGAPTRPLVFESRPGNTSGIIFVGDETTSPDDVLWSNRLRRYENGRVAIKVNLSLYGTTSDAAFLGVLLRKSVPLGALSKDAAYHASGIHVLFNRVGVFQVRRMLGTTDTVLHQGVLSSSQLAMLRTAQGLPVQIRSHNALAGYLELWIAGGLAAQVTDTEGLSGPHLALFASVPSGFAMFQERAPYDVSIEFVSRYGPWSGGVVSDLVVRTAPGVTEARSFDRANLPAIFLSQTTFSEATRQIARVHHQNGQYVLEDVIAQSYPVYGQFGWWAGDTTGHFGVLAIPEVVTVDGQPSPGAHVFLKKKTEGGEFVLMVNPLAPEAVTEARELRFRARWSTSLMDAKE